MARSAYAFMMGNTNQYTTALNFKRDSETADPDKALDLNLPGMKGERQAEEARQYEDAQIELESDNLEY